MKILFLLRDHKDNLEIFSSYLQLFEKNDFETNVFKIKPVFSKRDKIKHFVLIYSEINKFKPDFVYLGDEFLSKNALFIAFLRKFLKYKIITYIASQYIPEYQHTHGYRFFNKIKLKFLINNIDILLCRNKKELEKIKNMDLFENHFNLYQIYLGVPKEFFPKIQQSKEIISGSPDVLKENYSKIKDKYVLGFIGRVVPEKGLDVLLDCLKRLPNNFVLLCVGKVGDSDYEKKVKDFIKTNNLIDRVIWLGYVKSKDLKYIYNISDLIVMPTTKEYNNFIELFGSIIPEAMFCQTMIIGSDNGSIPEIIGRKDLVFKQSDREDLLRVINYIYNLEPEQKEKILNKNYQKASLEYNAETFVKTIIKAIL